MPITNDITHTAANTAPTMNIVVAESETSALDDPAKDVADLRAQECSGCEGEQRRATCKSRGHCGGHLRDQDHAGNGQPEDDHLEDQHRLQHNPHRVASAETDHRQSRSVSCPSSE